MHNFEIKILPSEATIMVCKCGLTYMWRDSGYWRKVGFEDETGRDIDAPQSCDEPEEQKQEGGESE